MKTFASLFALFGSVIFVTANSTIDPSNRYAWGANIGWLDWRGDTNHGAVIGEYVCSGYIYSANCGWINLGNGSPTNGIRYQNLDASDFGVNHDGFGNLRGFAWGANIGWLNFETNGAPRIDLQTGQLNGYLWSANCGWISLSNGIAHVQTDAISGGILAPNGLPVAWLLSNFGTTNINANADADGDGVSNSQEYLAGTNPNDPNDYLRIVSMSALSPGTSVNLTWSSVSNRSYLVQETLDLANSLSWLDSGLGVIHSDGLTTTRLIANTNAPVRLYRVQVFRPLTP